MLEQYHPDGWNTGELTRPHGRGINFQIEVDDIEQILTRVHAHGVTLYRDLHDSPYSIGESSACQESFSCRIQMVIFCGLVSLSNEIIVSASGAGREINELKVRCEREADVIHTSSGAKKLKGFKLVELYLTSLRHQRAPALEKLYAIRLG